MAGAVSEENELTSTPVSVEDEKPDTSTRDPFPDTSLATQSVHDTEEESPDTKEPPKVTFHTSMSSAENEEELRATTESLERKWRKWEVAMLRAPPLCTENRAELRASVLPSQETFLTSKVTDSSTHTSDPALTLTTDDPEPVSHTVVA
jgi:hypothetical protein